METLLITVNCLPPSENHALLRSRNGRLFPSKEYKKWKDMCKLVKLKGSINQSKWYGVERKFYFPLFFKNGSVRRKDVSNLCKYTDDELSKLVGIDDKLILEGSEAKFDCKEGEERTEWIIYTIG